MINTEKTIELEPMPMKDILSFSIACLIVPILILLPVYFVLTNKPDFLQYIFVLLIIGLMLSVYIFTTHIYFSRFRNVVIKDNKIYITTKLNKTNVYNLEDLEKIVFITPKSYDGGPEVYVVTKDDKIILEFCPNYFTKKGILSFINRLRESNIEIPKELEDHMKLQK